MQKERWQDILGMIKDRFEVEEHDSFEEEGDGGGQTEYIVFKSPLGRVRLEFCEKPVVLDRKTRYSNRIGSETKVEYVYSDTEKTARMSVFLWDAAVEEWQAIDPVKFNKFL